MSFDCSTLYPGQIVYFKRLAEDHHPWLPMRVTHIGMDSINGVLLTNEDARNPAYTVKEGVFHESNERLKNDPDFTQNIREDQTMGIFTLTPFEIEYRALKSTVALLQKQVAELLCDATAQAKPHYQPKEPATKPKSAAFREAASKRMKEINARKRAEKAEQLVGTSP